MYILTVYVSLLLILSVYHAVRFDSAMVAFLDCLQQFKEQVERGDSQFCLPYRMSSGGKIEDTSTGSSYSIKYVCYPLTSCPTGNKIFMGILISLFR